MKTTRRFIYSANGLAATAVIALALPAAAIEKPAGQENPKAENETKKQAALEAPGQNVKPQPKAKQIAWVGIGGSPASEPLSKHLGLEPGKGLTIFHVCPESAAAKAGIRVHDVITRFDGKKIGSIEELRDAVTARSPGDEVAIELIHEGKAIEKKVALGSRTEGAVHAHPHPDQDVDPRWRGMGHLPKVERDRLDEAMKEHFDEMKKFLENDEGLAFDFNGLMDILPDDERDKIRQKLQGNDLESLEFMERIKKNRRQAIETLKQLREGRGQGRHQAHIENLENSIKKLDESLKRIEEVEALFGKNKAARDLGLMGLQDLLDQGDAPKQPEQKAFNFNFKAQASVSLMDNEGSVTIKTIDGKKEVVVKDKAGKILFEGPYQTDQDKAAVPDDYRERIEAFNFSGFQQR